MQNPTAAGARLVLVVDLDHTLLKTDLLVEQVLALVRTHPLALVRALWGLAKSGGNRAAFKEAIARSAGLDAAYLPYRESVLALIDAERRAGGKVVLASASQLTLVTRIARHLSRFDHVLGSGEVNLKGHAKLEAIRGLLGQSAFAYVGDSAADRAIWAESQRAVAVNPNRRLLSWLRGRGIPVTVLEDGEPLLPALLRQLRAHQWVRNLLVLVPLLAAHRLFSAAAWGASALAFLAFSCLASAGYSLNDMTDLDADRRDPTKADRPLASGAVSVPVALSFVVGLVVLAAAGAAFLPRPFAWTLAGYFALTVAYSLRFKRVLMLDVVVLAALYTLRILAGGAATGIHVSPWLPAFSIFLFFGLGMLKVYAETAGATEVGVHARGYRPDDAQAVLGIGAAGSLVAVLVLGLYLGSDAVSHLYRRPALLWLLVLLLLYWLSRLWILAGRDEVRQDPMAFAARDRVTWGVALAGLVALLLAI